MPIRIAARRWGLSKRSQVLLVFGGLWVLFGVGIALTDAPEIPGLIHTYAPTWLRSLCWVLCGTYAWFVGASRTNRDAWAFTALTIMPMVRLVSSLIAFVMWLIPGGPVGIGAAWMGACVWAAVVQILMILADWPNPIYPRLNDE